MLTTDDIGVLFASMRTAYGPQWKHSQDAMPVWFNALKHRSPVDVRKAMNATLTRHIDFPPTLPQFLQIADGPKPRPSTYLPAPESTHAQRAAQLTMLKIVVNDGPIQEFTLKLMKELKDALVGERGDKPVDQEFIDDLQGQLIGLVEKQAA